MDKLTNPGEVISVEHFLKEAKAYARPIKSPEQISAPNSAEQITNHATFRQFGGEALTLGRRQEKTKQPELNKEEYAKYILQIGQRITAYRRQALNEMAKQDLPEYNTKTGLRKLVDSIGKIIPLALFRNQAQEPPTEQELLRAESQIGQSVFGKPPQKVTQREFVCLGEKTWLWYEQETKNGEVQELTTRYEIQPQGVLKIQPNCQYSLLEGAELENFIRATQKYHNLVAKELYKKDSRISQNDTSLKSSQPDQYRKVA